MSTFDRIEAGMPRLLTELANPRTPDYLGNVVRRTAGSPQRPGWTFLERWLPMSVTTFGSTIRSNVPWRTVGAITVLLLTLVGGALILAGSRQPTVPAPFGPARPGLVVYEAAGDLFTADPASGVSKPLLTGPTADVQPRWSPDGTKIVFRREGDAGLDAVYVLEATGGGLTLVTPQPLPGIQDHIFSPDGRSVLITSSSGDHQVISIAAADGRSIREIDVPNGASLPSFRPPNGRSFVFITGVPFSTEGQGLSTYDLQTGTVSTIISPMAGAEIIGRPEYSPDGLRIAYSAWAPDFDADARVYTANADGTNDRPVESPPDICCEAMPTWSNDGSRLAMTRWYDQSREVIAMVPWDRGGIGTEFEVPGLYRA